jgi:hypothetical protein
VVWCSPSIDSIGWAWCWIRRGGMLFDTQDEDPATVVHMLLDEQHAYARQIGAVSSPLHVRVGAAQGATHLKGFAQRR